MKLLIVSLFFSHLLLSYEYTVIPNKISSHVYCFFGLPEVMDKHNNGNIVNSCFVDLGSSYLVIDTGPSYKYARDTHKAMKKIKNQNVSHVMITHIHDDHWLGNGYYKDNGAVIIGPEIFANTPKSEKTRMQQYILPEAYEGTHEVFPTELVDGEKILTIDGVKLELKAYKHNIHSPNDMVIYIPSKDVVFAGDLVFNDRILSLKGGNINNWIKAIDEIASKGYSYIIGGHGTAYTKASIDVTRNYLHDVKAFVKESLDEGLDIIDALEASHMPKYQDLKLYEMMHRVNVESAYRTLEWGDE